MEQNYVTITLRVCICVPKKGDTKLMAVTLLILDRFSNFFRSQAFQ